ncbi:MAG TPA: hypothetical protein VLT59_12110 [Steroidobacteraceae bacterium]|nr:hypothetical protein [Steroidobacteraceae bacterium]
MAIGDGLRQLLKVSKPPVEDERLLELYWNRAELKKAFSNLQGERYALSEELKREQAAALRSKEQLEELEDHLGDPEAGFSAVTYFQLRRLWRDASERLVKFAGELGRQQEERERRRQLIEFDQNRRRKLAAIDRQLLESQSSADTLEAQLKLMQTRYEALAGFWNYFKRRKLAEGMAAQQERWRQAGARVEELNAARAEAVAMQPPEFVTLSVDGRRTVNVATIAFAQYLLSRLADGGLAILARETTVKRVFDVHYGSVDECVRLMAVVRSALEMIAEERDDLSAIKDRTEALRAGATYRSDADSVPLPDSIGVVPLPDAPVSDLEATSRAGGVNVLIDDYWDIYRALLS